MMETKEGLTGGYFFGLKNSDRIQLNMAKKGLLKASRIFLLNLAALCMNT